MIERDETISYYGNESEYPVESQGKLIDFLEVLSIRGDAFVQSLFPLCVAVMILFKIDVFFIIFCKILVKCFLVVYFFM